MTLARLHVLDAFRRDVMDRMEDDETYDPATRDRVYQLGLQLFPVTR